jgi:hypothetical protein
LPNEKLFKILCQLRNVEVAFVSMTVRILESSVVRISILSDALRDDLAARQ